MECIRLNRIHAQTERHTKKGRLNKLQVAN